MVLMTVWNVFLAVKDVGAHLMELMLVVNLVTLPALINLHALFVKRRHLKICMATLLALCVM